MDDVPLPLPTQTSEIRDVHRIAPTFIIDVADDGFKKVCATICKIGCLQLQRDGNVERAIGRKVPTAGAETLRWIRKTRAISALARKSRLILRDSLDFSATFRKKCRVQF